MVLYRSIRSIHTMKDILTAVTQGRVSDSLSVSPALLMSLNVCVCVWMCVNVLVMGEPNTTMGVGETVTYVRLPRAVISTSCSEERRNQNSSSFDRWDTQGLGHEHGSVVFRVLFSPSTFSDFHRQASKVFATLRSDPHCRCCCRSSPSQPPSPLSPPPPLSLVSFTTRVTKQNATATVSVNQCAECSFTKGGRNGCLIEHLLHHTMDTTTKNSSTRDLASSLFVHLVGGSVGWLVGWMIGWMDGWMIGGCVDVFVYSVSFFCSSTSNADHSISTWS